MKALDDSMLSARKLVALLCFTAVLFAALSPRSADQCWAILVPFLFVLGLASVIWAERPRQEIEIFAIRYLPVSGTRAPPAAYLADLN